MNNFFEAKDEDKKSTENANIKKARTGIKLPWWIGYPILLIVIILFGFLIYKAFNPNFTVKTFSEIYNKELMIECNKTQIGVGKTISIDLNNDNENVELHTSNPEIISVQGKNISGLAVGEATIWATYKDKKSNELKFECIVELEDIIINKSETEIVVGNTEELVATIIPDNGLTMS